MHGENLKLIFMDVMILCKRYGIP